MIGIFIQNQNGTWQGLDMPSNITFSGELLNPMFRTEIGASSYTYPITVPASERNNRVLQHVNIANVIQLPQKGRIDIGGVTFLEGDVLITAANAKSISISIVSNRPNNKWLETLLPDIDMGTYTMVSGSRNTYAMAVANNPVYGAGYDFAYVPHMNQMFTGTLVPNQVMNLFLFGSEFHNANDLPFVYLMASLKAIANNNGLTLAGSFVSNEEMRRLLVFNTRKVRINPSTGDDEIDLSLHLPNVSIREYLQGLNSYLNLVTRIDHISGQLIIDLNIDDINNFVFQDWTKKVEPNISIEPQPQTGWTMNIGIDSNDSIFENMDKMVLNLSRVKGSVQNPASLPITANRGDVYYISSLHKWGVWNGAWRITSYGEAPTIIVGEGAKQISTIFSAPRMRKFTPVGAFQQTMPEVSMLGNTYSSATTQDENPFSSRLLFFRGMKQGGGANFYPMASNDVFANDGTKIPEANHSLNWAGEYGLYEKRYKRWLQLLEGKRCTFIAPNLSIGDLLSLQITKKVWIRDAEYYIVSMPYTINKHGNVRATIKCLYIS